jgi:hypothetical protein
LGSPDSVPSTNREDCSYGIRHHPKSFIFF